MPFDAVCRSVGLSRWTINRLIAEGRFPRPVDRGTRTRSWRPADVRAFKAR
ncbi:MAG: helix-turn-helix transcriptional regulator [Vicinamibacterales bacterium]